MTFLDTLFGRTPAEAVDPVQSVIVTPRRPFVHKPALESAGLRNGMWVVTSDGRVGILTGCGIDALAEVTLTKPDGTNLMMLDQNDNPVAVRVLSPLADLAQAYIEEIPLPRRPAVEALLALGYKSGSIS
jgi:hypothetical protein